ncbi:hypothetical protein BD309DRAFT_523876 [Dichomitus squalens]|nr:hypothetical protein BD309DRAFT_523876 [Dichomitus squalens]
MVVPARLALKADAQVMLVKNVDERLVNGSVGRVLGFCTIAACAASVGGAAASSQGREDVKPFGGLGVGGSKPKSVSGSQESNASGSSVKANGAIRNVQVGADGRTPIALCGRTPSGKENMGPAAASAQADVKPSSAKGKAKDEELYPLVEFRTQQGTEVVLVVRDEFRVEDNEGKLLARRVQVRPSPRATRARVGDVDTQEPGADDRARQDRPPERVREGPELRRAVARGVVGGLAGLGLRPKEGQGAPEGD